MGDVIIVNRLKLFFEKNGISTKNVAITTIQKSDSTEFSTLVANFDEGDVIPNYPLPIDYQEMTLPKDVPMSQCKWLIAYKEALPVPQFNRDGPEKVFNKPFCCSDIVPYKPRILRPISLEQAYRNFVNGTGNHPSIIFEVKCQISNGPLLYTDYFQITENKVEQVIGKFTNKKQAYKNYLCTTHNLFYAVDVYDRANNVVHHMRLDPFTKINTELMEEFFRFVDV